MTEQDIQDINNQYQDQIVYWEKKIIESAYHITTTDFQQTNIGLMQQCLHNMQRFLNEIHVTREKQQVIKDFYG